MESETAVEAVEATEQHTNGAALAEEPQAEEAKPRRTPLSFAEKLDRMGEQKRAALAKVKTRETTQVVELERTRIQREGLERELLGIERAKAEADG